jgi:hypothetical protein
MRRSRRAPLPLAALVGAVVLLALAALWTPRPAAAALTADSIRIVNRPASVRAIIHFRGARLTGLANQVDTIDPDITDGRAVVRVNAAGIRTIAPAAGRAGVVVQIARRSGHIVVLLDERAASAGRFKFVSYRTSTPRNVLVIDLWKATTRRAATIRADGCLSITRWGGGSEGTSARGRELQPLFEHNLVLSLRLEGAGGATVALRAVTARPGRFRPDFSGYSVPGRWSGTLRHSVSGPTRAMLEAWSSSAKDGSLECLVQVPVVLRP